MRDVGLENVKVHLETIESFDPGLESFVKLCCIWRGLADSPEQLASEGLRFVKGIYGQVYGVSAVAIH